MKSGSILISALLLALAALAGAAVLAVWQRNPKVRYRAIHETKTEKTMQEDEKASRNSG